MNIKFYGLALSAIAVAGGITLITYANSKDDQKQVSNQTVSPQSSARMAHIDPDTGKLISKPADSTAAVSSRTTGGNPAPVIIRHADGSESADVSMYRTEIHATIDKSGEISFSDKQTINKKDTAETSEKEMSHE